MWVGKGGVRNIVHGNKVWRQSMSHIDYKEATLPSASERKNYHDEAKQKQFYTMRRTPN